MAPETTGTINVEALKTLVLNQVLNIKSKSHDTFEHNGQVYQSKRF